MSPVTIALIVVIVLLTIVSLALWWMLTSGLRQVRRQSTDPILNRLMEHHEKLSADRVAETERVLAAFVEHSKDSNQHMSGIMTHDSRPNLEPTEQPPPAPTDADWRPEDYFDPTDWGATMPAAPHETIAPYDPNSPEPFGIPGLKASA